MKKEILNKHLRIASEYEYLKDLRKDHKSTYTYFANTGNLHMISHLKKLGDRVSRCVYVYTFDDKSVYVGLTYDLRERDNSHKRNQKSPIYKKIEERIDYTLTQMTDYIPAKLAQLEEGRLVDEFKSNGFNVLNKQKAGNLGGREKINFTEKEIFAIAKICKNAGDMSNEYHTHYKRASEKGILRDLVFSDGKKTSERCVTWDKETVKKLALKCSKASEMARRYSGAYRHAQQNKYLKELKYKTL